MHNQGLESVFSELWECERREGWLAGLKQETMPPEQDWMGKGMAILPTRAKRQKAYRLWFIPNSRSFLEIDGKKVYLFSEVSHLLNNDHIPISDYFKPDSVLIFSYDQQRIYNHNRLINYLKRAKLLYFEQGKLRICNSPATLYLPTIKVDSLVRSEARR